MPDFNLEQARFNMVEQQIRPWNMFDQRVLDLMAEVPREQFVPEKYRHLAFADTEIPLANSQVMMSPKIEARILQALMIHPSDNVLEIGTGSGYFTALLAKSAKHVDSVDIFEDFVESAQSKLNSLNINNVELSVGDAINGWHIGNNYDVIVLTGSVPILQPHFQEQLKEGGGLFAIVGEQPVMQAQLINRITEDDIETQTLFETSITPLLGAPEPARFVF
jgi:protein-L-isoaspartate(D-aspartate) O-methyltransferase